MEIKTLKGAYGIARAMGEASVVSNRNRVIESKKYKKRYTESWKKDTRNY